MNKYIYFEEDINGKFFRIKNKKTQKDLGYIYYYKNWKQYIFTQADEGIIFSWDCLQDIISFIKDKNQESQP